VSSIFPKLSICRAASVVIGVALLAVSLQQPARAGEITVKGEALEIRTRTGTVEVRSDEVQTIRTEKELRAELKTTLARIDLEKLATGDRDEAPHEVSGSARYTRRRADVTAQPGKEQRQVAPARHRLGAFLGLG